MNNEFDREQSKEMLRQVRRYEKHKQTGEKIWLDSDNYIDIIDWYYENGKDELAKQAVKEAYQLYDTNEEIVYLYAGLFASEGNYDKAIEIVKKALQKNPSEDLYIDLAALYVDSDTDIDGALKILNSLQPQNQQDYYVYLLKGRIYLKLADIVTAEQYLRKSITLNPDEELSFCYYIECAEEDASLHEDYVLMRPMVGFMYDFTRSNPFNDFAWSTLGTLYLVYKFFPEATEAFDYSIAINPEGEQRYLGKAESLVMQNRPNEALQVLIDAPKYPDNKGRFYIKIADIYLNEGIYYTALLWLKEAEKYKEQLTDKSYISDMAICYYMTGNYDKGKTKLIQAMNESLSVDMILDLCGILYEGGATEVEDFFEMLIVENLSTDIAEKVCIKWAELKVNEKRYIDAMRIIEATVDDKITCSEYLWYEYLYLACKDKQCYAYATKAMSVAARFKSFPEKLIGIHPDLTHNPIYLNCIKEYFNE
ncbi:MAG: tetratricopeptide repeat protein [Bacteroidales bacterium]|nr:tetratricopeptide repeat protein [Bacteroidales bacterium]